MIKIATRSPQETRKLASVFATRLKPRDVLAIFGKYGAGKTTFLKGLAKGLKIKKRITSPSFVIMQVHNIKTRGAKRFYHFDLYRLKSALQLRELGLAEALSDQRAITAIEWPGVAKKFLPKSTLAIHIALGKKPSERIITLKSL